MSVLSPGVVCAGRFRIDHAAGSGAVGMVYRATDLATSEPIALKLLHAASLSADERARFNREATILAGLRHPGIARYVEHGVLPGGKAYLAMEWLEGETLAQRLTGRGLTLAETLRCMRTTAAALAVAHEQGIVHRDIKPSNLFLRASDVERVVLLDFGLARRGHASQVLTRSGTLLGTPEYMSPEQARGSSKLTAASDVFSLGCIFFECLTGAPPFVADYLPAVLAKVLFEPLPDLCQLRPQIPEPVAHLLTAMLARSESQRPRSAQAVLSQLDLILRSRLPALPAPARGGERERSRRRSTSAPEQGQPAGPEQVLVSVLLCRLASAQAPAEGEPSEPDVLSLPGLSSLMSRLSALGVDAVPLADGSLVLSFFGSWGEATDQVEQAARCALLLAEHGAPAQLSVATGRGALSQQVPIGEALDRAAALLAAAPLQPDVTTISLDEVTAGLLDSRFVIRRGADGQLGLLRAHFDADSTRCLLGQPTPYVGREHELTALDSLLDGVIEEHIPRAMVVTAAAGIGKSRLRHEFLHRVASRGEPVRVLVGRCEPLLMAVPLGVFAELLRKHFGLHEIEDPALARAQLGERLAALPATWAGFERELLSELVGLPLSDENVPLVAAARQDGRLFRSLLVRTLSAWLQGECAVAPVLLVLEDLHWSDVLTVSVLADVLSSLPEARLGILALARPEALERFPKLWAPHAQIIPLRPLSRRASERLIVQVLGSRSSAELAAELTELAEGNALFLEELIRHAAEHSDGQRPETVLALLQNRISRLDSPCRRILRLASIFGESFSQAGIAALLNGSLTAAELTSWLSLLCRAELVQLGAGRARSGRTSADTGPAYRFRHALLRDAAYGLLSRAEQQQGHRRAAEFLAQAEGATAIVLAEHLLRSGDASLALPYLMRAANSAWTQASPSESLRLVEKALAAGAQGQQRGEFLAIRAVASVYSEDHATALASARAARTDLTPGSRYWYLSLNTSTVAAGLTGDFATLMEAIQLFESAAPTPDVAVGFGEAAGVVGSMYTTLSLRQPLERLAARCREFIAAHGVAALPYRALAPLQLPAYFLHRVFTPQPFSALADVAQSIEYVDRAGEPDMPPIFGGAYARALMDVGRFAEANECIEKLSAQAREQRNSWSETLVAYYALGGPLWPIDPLGLLKLEAWIAVVRKNPKAPRLFQGTALAAAAHLCLQRGDLAQAWQLGQASLELLMPMATRSAATRIVLSQVQLARGQAEAALSLADEGLACLARVNAWGSDELPLRLCRLKSLQVLRAHEPLVEEAQAARAGLAQRQADAPSPAAWQAYLALPCHAELLQVCQAVLGS